MVLVQQHSNTKDPMENKHQNIFKIQLKIPLKIIFKNVAGKVEGCWLTISWMLKNNVVGVKTRFLCWYYQKDCLMFSVGLYFKSTRKTLTLNYIHSIASATLIFWFSNFSACFTFFLSTNFVYLVLQFLYFLIKNNDVLLNYINKNSMEKIWDGFTILAPKNKMKIYFPKMEIF